MEDQTRGRAQLRPYILSAVVCAGVVLFAAAFFVLGFATNELVSDDEGGTAVVAQPSPSGGTPSAQPTAPTTPSPPAVVAASADDDPFIGPADAPVTIIDFSDFQ